MLPFAYQVKANRGSLTRGHRGVRRGVFSPDMTPPPETFAALKARITETLAALEAIEASEVDGFIGATCALHSVTGMPISRPRISCCPSRNLNFYFHATTAYGILRWKGSRSGKRDFIGRLRTKQ